MQILADTHGAVLVAGTRDCTLQRRYQKIVEEAPAPFLAADQRATLGRVAAAICREAGYVNARTVEFLLSPAGSLSFLEVDTRLQVEHSATEETIDVDLVRAQLLIAAGRPLAAAIGETGAVADLPSGPDGLTPCGGTRSSSGSTPRPPARGSPPRPGRSPACGCRPARRPGGLRHRVR